VNLSNIHWRLKCGPSIETKNPDKLFFKMRVQEERELVRVRSASYSSLDELPSVQSAKRVPQRLQRFSLSRDSGENPIQANYPAYLVGAMARDSSRSPRSQNLLRGKVTFHIRWTEPGRKPVRHHPKGPAAELMCAGGRTRAAFRAGRPGDTNLCRLDSTRWGLQS